ncbi:MAG: putative Ig domain-containing protein [bacterium]
MKRFLLLVSLMGVLFLMGIFSASLEASNQPPQLDPIGDKEVKEGELLEFTITATDLDGDELHYSASNLPPGVSFDTKTQTFKWTPAYGQAGTYTISFEARDRSEFEKPKERGIIQLFRKNDDIDANIDNPYLAGAKIATIWSNIQPKEGVFDWSVIDGDMKIWTEAGKKVRLAVYISSYAGWSPELKCATPEWVFKGSPSARYIQYNPDGTVTLPPDWDERDRTTTYPVIWDLVFKEKYKKFVEAFGEKYDGNPNVLYVQIGLFPEMTLGKDAGSLTDYWRAEGYSYDVYEETIKWIIDRNLEAFDQTPCSLALNAPEIMNEDEKERLWQEVSSYLNSKGGWLQNNSYKARSYYDYWAQKMFRKYHQSTNIVYQAWGSSKTQPEQQGSFRDASCNALRAHPDFLEIYAADIAEPSHQEDLRFAYNHVGIEPDCAENIWIQLTDLSENCGSNDFYQGLYQVDVIDKGLPEQGTILGKTYRKTNDSNPYIYFQVDPNFINGGSNSIEIKVTYFDTGNDTFSLEYDAIDKIYKEAGIVTKNNTNQWLTATFTLTDAHFAKRQPGGTTLNEAESLEKGSRTITGTDFRINSKRDGDEYIHFVQVIKEKPGLSDVETITITVKTDATPPGTITDLSVATVTSRSITLTWTTPGDDGYVGTATTYDLRWATYTITSDNFGSVTTSTRTKVTQPAYGTETFIVTGLQPNTTYWFAIKTADEVPNWSDLSNVATRTTTPSSPKITLTKKASKQKVYSKGTITYTITYKNEGQATAMDVSIIDVLPKNTVLESEVKSQESEVSYWYGGDWQESFNQSATKIRWIIDEVGPGQSGSVSFTVRVK